jgi:hypothetical protein
MTVRLPIFDDDESSPKSYRHSRASGLRSASGASRSGSVLGTSKLQNYSKVSESQSERPSRGWGKRVIIVVLLALLLRLMYIAWSVYSGEDGSFVESDGHQSASQESSETTSNSSHFVLYSFLESLSEGECFSLESDPVWYADGSISQIAATDGRVVDCALEDAQYRFVKVEDVTPDDVWLDGRKKSEGRSRIIWKQTGRQHVYDLLPYEGRVISFDFRDDGLYSYYPRYLPNDYTLPENVAEYGVVNVSRDVSDCRERGGRLVTLDDVDTCWTITERK